VAEETEVRIDVPRRGFSEMWGKLGVNVLQSIAMDTVGGGEGFRRIIRVKEKSGGETKEHAVRLFRVCIARIGKELHVRSPRVGRSKGHGGIKTLTGKTSCDGKSARAIMVGALKNEASSGFNKFGSVGEVVIVGMWFHFAVVVESGHVVVSVGLVGGG